MAITTFPWALTLQTEANKCWFYAISFSILFSLSQLLRLVSSTPAYKDIDTASDKAKEDEKRAKIEEHDRAKAEVTSELRVQLTH